MQAKRQLPKERSNQGAMNLLLIDDDDIALFTYRRIANSSGYFASIRSATDGRTALHILNEAAKGVFSVPNVILLDLEMPVINAVTFLKAVKKLDMAKQEDLSIIVMIDRESETSREAIMELGVTYFLSKPISFESFNDLVEIVAEKTSKNVRESLASGIG